MADYSTASGNAETALNSAADGFVEEYEISQTGRRVKRGKLTEQVAAAALLEGLASRRSGGGISRVGKFRDARK